jgi:hypothetical protein
MSISLGKSYKVCATCEYWSGNRERAIDKTSVKLDGLSVKGKCIKQNFPYIAGGHCSKYTRWGVLE